MSKVRFNEIIEKCNTKNASGNPCFSIGMLEEKDLVELYDEAPDYSYIFEIDGLAEFTCESAGVNPSKDNFEDVYEEAVEILRKRLAK